MNAIGVSDDLVHIVGKGVACLIEWVHLERSATLAGNSVVVPPGELGDEDSLVVALHQEVVDGILQHLLSAVTQKHLVLGNIVNLTQSYTYDTLLPLVVDAGVETECAWVEVLYRFDDLLGRLEIEFVSV